jgi:hypothetical protein
MRSVATGSSGRSMPVIAAVIIAALAALGIFFVWPG